MYNIFSYKDVQYTWCTVNEWKDHWSSDTMLSQFQHSGRICMLWNDATHRKSTISPKEVLYLRSLGKRCLQMGGGRHTHIWMCSEHNYVPLCQLIVRQKKKKSLRGQKCPMQISVHAWLDFHLLPKTRGEVNVFQGPITTNPHVL